MIKNIPSKSILLYILSRNTHKILVIKTVRNNIQNGKYTPVQ